MTPASFFALIATGTIVSWSAWGLLLFSVDPFDAGWYMFGLFYASLWLALSGTIMMLSYGWRVWRDKDTLAYIHMRVAVRHGILFACLLVGYLQLQAHRLAGFMNMFLLIFALAMIELFFVSYQRTKRHEHLSE